MENALMTHATASMTALSETETAEILSFVTGNVAEINQLTTKILAAQDAADTARDKVADAKKAAEAAEKLAAEEAKAAEAAEKQRIKMEKKLAKKNKIVDAPVEEVVEEAPVEEKPAE